MDCFVGIDGGGSKTLCLVAERTGRLLGAGSGGPTNTNFVSPEVARRSLCDALGSAWRASGPPLEPPRGAAISGPIPLPLAEEVIVRVTGGRGPASGEGAIDTVILPQDAFVPGAGTERVIRTGEGEAAWQAVLPWTAFEYGVAVDAGTGSLAFGYNRDGKWAGVGGWGTILGDEGSGYWIGLHGVRAAIRARDGREPPTRLCEAIGQALGIDSLNELIPLFYHQGIERHEVAALCPAVAEVARQGDARAQAIFDQAGRELARAVVAVIRQLEMTDDAFAVVPFGSVFKAGELILAPFWEEVHRAAPRAQLVLPRYEPVVGTLLIAMRQGGVQIEQILPRLEKGLDAEPCALAQSS